MHWICIVSTAAYLVIIPLAWRVRFVRVVERELAVAEERRREGLWRVELGYNKEGRYGRRWFFKRHEVNFRAGWWAVFWPFMLPVSGAVTVFEWLYAFASRPTPTERRERDAELAAQVEKEVAEAAKKLQLPIPKG